MTKTRTILMAMIADGQTRTNASLREEFGLTSGQASTILRALVKARFLEIAPITYTLTDVGRRHVAARSEQHAAALEKKAAYMARRRGKQREEMKPAPPINVQSMVRTAMQSRPALDMAWMSVAREQEGAHA